MKQRECVVHIAVNSNGGAHIVVAILVCGNLQGHALKAHTVVVIDLALVLLAQDVRQVAADERPEFVNDFETPEYINLVCNRVVFC